MKSEIVRNFPMVGLTIAALMIFFSFFVLTWLRTYSQKQKRLHAELAMLPLEEGQHDEQNT